MKKESKNITATDRTRKKDENTQITEGTTNEGAAELAVR